MSPCSLVPFAALLFSCAVFSAENLVRVRVTRGEGASTMKYDLTITLSELKKLRAEPDVVSIQMLGAPNAHQPNIENSDWSSGTYIYDGAGNITQIGTDRVGSAACESNPAISSATNRLSTVAGTYDAAGNLITLGSYSYVYDVTNTVKSTSDGVTKREYVYTADGERLAAYSHPINISSGSWTWTVRDLGSHILREYTSTGSTGRRAGRGKEITSGAAMVFLPRRRVTRRAEPRCAFTSTSITSARRDW